MCHFNLHYVCQLDSKLVFKVIGFWLWTIHSAPSRSSTWSNWIGYSNSGSPLWANLFDELICCNFLCFASRFPIFLFKRSVKINEQNICWIEFLFRVLTWFFSSCRFLFPISCTLRCAWIKQKANIWLNEKNKCEH